MSEAIKEKLCLKMLEKFGKTLEIYLEQHPNKTDQEGLEEGSKKESNLTEEPDSTGNNTTKLFKKRALFSQTCNTLLEESSEKELKEPIANSIKDLVGSIDTSASDGEDEVFATPKIARMVPTGELEITRVEESPLAELDNSLSEELVSGNLVGMAIVVYSKSRSLSSVLQRGERP